jgi:signal transduction histidine kinase
MSKQKAMVSACKSINIQYNITDDDSTSQYNFRFQIEAMANSLDSRILIVSPKKYIYMDSDKSSKSKEKQFIDNEIIQNVLQGKTIKKTGYYADFLDHPVVTVAIPIKNGTEIEGAIIMNSPLPILQQNMNIIYKLTFISVLIILIITFSFTYLFSKKIAVITNEFSRSTREIANGNFSSRINIKFKSKHEIYHLANNLNYMAEELEKLEDMRKDFIANISHDFRSPLTSIKGFVQAVIDGTIPYEKQDKYLNIVLDETERLTKLTNDILLLTKMESNTIQLEPCNFDIHQIIRKSLLQFEHKILSKNINITLLIDKKELLVYADINKIQRVIANLIDNAVKFCSPNDEILIETSTKKDKVKISIKDTGPGISKEDIKYIWDRFHKADRSRGKDKKGIGLGLSIVREIIKAHNEVIDVYSQEGKGTTFVFYLPLADSEKHLRLFK